MKWPDLTRTNMLAAGFALFLGLSLAALHATPLGLGPLMTDSDTTATVGNTTDPASPNATRQRHRTASLNCSTLGARQLVSGSKGPLTALNTSRAAPPAPTSNATFGNSTRPAERYRLRTVNGTSPAPGPRYAVPATTRETCRLLAQSARPDWLIEMTETAAATEANTSTGETHASLDAYTNTTVGARAQLSMARNLRDIFTDPSRSRREATFDAAELALVQRRAEVAGSRPNASATSQLAVQQTKLRGARALLTAAETDRESHAGTLARTASLTERGLELQAARVKHGNQHSDPTEVTLPDTTMPEYDTPSTSAFAILAAQNVDVTSDKAADIRALDDLPEPTRRELTDVLNAYLRYFRTTQTAAGANKSRVWAAQLQLLREAADLETALEDTDGSGSAGPAANGSVDPDVQITGVLSIDLAKDDNTYTKDFNLQIDAMGDDTYNNNAGGANASGNSTDAAALIDLGGTDTYNGRNGGARYIPTEQSPSVPDPRIFLPKKGEAAGFLLDAGTGNDTYTPSKNNGTNGGGRRAIGFLVDTGGHDIYDGHGKGTNGAAYKKGAGFLLDAGIASDTYAGSDTGVSNAGTNGGHGFLFDVGGNDTYKGSNGGAHRGVLNNWITRYYRLCETGPGERNIRDRACEILLGSHPNPFRAPESGGFLLDGGGSDTYEGSNGGAGVRGAGFLLDAGTGNDTYDGKNGGATRRGAIGFLLDLGGNDTYASGNGGKNGGGHATGFGFLMDGGTGDDTYDATTQGGTHHWQRQDLPPGSRGTNGGGWQNGRGFLADAGGNDEYIAGSVATNGGAIREREPRPGGSALPSKKARGFLLDVAGNDTYTAKQAAVNGGADAAVGLLYDGAGTDTYADYLQRCTDCSDIPKGTVGGQVDLGSGTGSGDSGGGSVEVLVVDDDAGVRSTDCPDPSYQEIQQAVNDAEYGDTVRVCAGTYPGNVTIDTPNVTLRAADHGQVVLDGAHKRRFGVTLMAGKTTVTEFTARNFAKTAFLSLGPQSTVSNNDISASRAGVIAAGLYTDSLFADTPVSQGGEATAITNNTVTNASLGIRVGGTASVKVAQNTIQETNRGIFLRRTGEVTVQNNRVSAQGVPADTEQRGITSLRSTDITMTDNTVTGFTAPERARPTGDIATGIGIEIRAPRGQDDDTTHTLRNNTMANNMYNLHVTSGRRSEYQHLDIAPTNTVNGKPVLYLVGATNLVIGSPGPGGQSGNTPAAVVPNQSDVPPLDALATPGYVACVSCTNVSVRDLDLKHNGQGVLIAKSSSMHVDNVTVHDTLQGISVQGSPSNTTVTHSTLRENFQGIVVRHNCASQQDFKVTSPLGLVFGKNTETCVTPSVVLAENTVRHNGLQVTKHNTYTRRKGPAISVAGAGVTVRSNTITDGYGTAIGMGGRLVRMNQQSGRTDTDETTDVIANSTVVNNDISNMSTGVNVYRSRGTAVIGNTITDTGVGFTTTAINSMAFRDNVVTNATIGLHLGWSVDGVTARNNSFREVRWGLDGQFHVLTKSASHDFGTSNTVNGERILWLNGAAGRTIDASDANMVVCVRCVDVTIRDMTISANGHGVVLFDSTASRVRNVTVEDTLRTGVLIKGGQNNTVRNTTIIDSIRPIWAMPSVKEGRRVRRDAGRVLPTNPPEPKQLPRDALGSVRLINNRVMVDDATNPWKVNLWGHFGIVLWDPTTAIVTGNTVTGNRWGIFHWRGHVSDIRIKNNTVRHPRQEVGFGRFGSNAHMGGPLAQMRGISVRGSPTGRANGSIEIRNNTLTAGTRPIGTQNQLYGISINGKELPPTMVADNRINGYGQSVRVHTKSNNSTVSIRRNRLNGAKSASVFVTGPTPGEAVAIHQNLLNPLAFGYGVKYSTQGSSGGHMGGGGDGGGATARHGQAVNATCNRWAAPSGPSSQRMTLIDPVTGEPADGNGSAVSQGHMHGESNVHFHPWLGESPRLSCAAAKVGTPTPTPIPTATRTPWPTVGAGSGTGPGQGAGTGPGQGDGTGPGQGDGTGPGRGTDDGGGTGTITATARLHSTATQTVTPPPTATPEIVPGFGVAGWLVAFGLLIAGFAALRRN